MYKIVLKHVTNKYEYEELIKVFLSPSQYCLVCGEEEEQAVSEEQFEKCLVFDFSHTESKNLRKKQIFDVLVQQTGKRPDWGILTGVRPVKLAGELVLAEGSKEKARERLLSFYMLTEEKADLILDTYTYQQQILPESKRELTGVYIGIPFCPTRCVYCSFTSNQVKPLEIQRYLEALHEEISFVAENMQKKGIYAESIYIGGGTPTTLNELQLQSLLEHVTGAFDFSYLKEFTLEAGRPDTITPEKLQIAKQAGVHRISINPQSMKAKTLELIGRDHSPEQIRQAFQTADEIGIPIVNADLIAGLPEETPEDFEASLREILELGAENITVHTLAVKRASKLIDLDPDFHYKQGEIVRKMLKKAEQLLSSAGYRPYYLYRQKHMAGSFENIGYCKENTEGIYNIRIMEEAQTIIALGAGGISKRYYSRENRLERVANVSNYELYIQRLSEMLERKTEHLF